MFPLGCQELISFLVMSNAFVHTDYVKTRSNLFSSNVYKNFKYYNSLYRYCKYTKPSYLKAHFIEFLDKLLDVHDNK